MGHQGQDNHRDLRSARDWHQLDENLESLLVREGNFKHYAINVSRPIEGQSRLAICGLKDLILSGTRLQMIGPEGALLLAAIDKQD
jgi:hypothetical protein